MVKGDCNPKPFIHISLTLYCGTIRNMPRANKSEQSPQKKNKNLFYDFVIRKIFQGPKRE